MKMERINQRAWISWISMSLLALACGILAVLQFRWIGEVSKAERQRLTEEVTAKLSLFRRAFNDEIERSATALVPSNAQIDELGREPAYVAQYKAWEQSHDRLFRRVALAIPQEGSVELLLLDPTSRQFQKTEWPGEWSGLRDRMNARLSGASMGPIAPDDTPLIELPRFAPGPVGPGHFESRRLEPPPDRGQDRERGGPPRRAAEQEWLVLELNLDYIRSTLLPDMLTRYLGDAGKLDYHAEVSLLSNPSVSIYRSLPEHSHPADAPPDGSVRILDIRPNLGRVMIGRGGPGFQPGGSPSQGRWLLQIRHHAGSLEAIVARTRWRNIAVSSGLLLLMLVTVIALLRVSRSAQQLAELQMNFVAGVSHELRTPLTVMSTAAYNLRGKIANNPTQVERYGALIQEQCERLTAIVEQVLLFAKTKSGSVLREHEPISVELLIQEELRANRAFLEKAGCKVETEIQPGLPVVVGDALALRHAFQNLITNAVKYGAEGGNWIGVFAASREARGGPVVEIRVADRGPGIPREEQARIFDPFFRGSRALQDQIHGTGLGLNLVKRIVEAHGGTIAVHSEPMQQTEFVIALPAAPQEIQDEVAHSFN
jgi:signal transduction histidine kinase